MAGEDKRRKELAKFLRSRRARIHPADIGLPVGPRRRTLGLRREEVAVLSGLSPTWYTYLEQGRKVSPSPSALDSLARVLQLSTAERHYLHMLAHGRPPTLVEPPVTETSAEEVARGVVFVARNSPYPVYAANWLCDMLAWNDAFTEWYTDFAALPTHNRNMLWWMLTDPVARDRLVNWEEETRDLIARFRTVSALRQGHPRYPQIVAELRATSPEFRKWWERYDVHGQQMRPRTLAHPVLGVRTFHLAVMSSSGQDENMVVFHPPATDDDKL